MSKLQVYVILAGYLSLIGLGFLKGPELGIGTFIYVSALCTLFSVEEGTIRGRIL